MRSLPSSDSSLPRIFAEKHSAEVLKLLERLDEAEEMENQEKREQKSP
jgi:hypothetical protein